MAFFLFRVAERLKFPLSCNNNETSGGISVLIRLINSFVVTTKRFVDFLRSMFILKIEYIENFVFRVYRLLFVNFVMIFLIYVTIEFNWLNS